MADWADDHGCVLQVILGHIQTTSTNLFHNGPEGRAIGSCGGTITYIRAMGCNEVVRANLRLRIGCACHDCTVKTTLPSDSARRCRRTTPAIVWGRPMPRFCDMDHVLCAAEWPWDLEVGVMRLHPFADDNVLQLKSLRDNLEQRCVPGSCHHMCTARHARRALESRVGAAGGRVLLDGCPACWLQGQPFSGDQQRWWRLR